MVARLIGRVSGHDLPVWICAVTGASGEQPCVLSVLRKITQHQLDRLNCYKGETGKSLQAIRDSSERTMAHSCIEIMNCPVSLGSGWTGRGSGRSLVSRSRARRIQRFKSGAQLAHALARLLCRGAGRTQAGALPMAACIFTSDQKRPPAWEARRCPIKAGRGLNGHDVPMESEHCLIRQGRNIAPPRRL